MKTKFKILMSGLALLAVAFLVLFAFAPDAGMIVVSWLTNPLHLGGATMLATAPVAIPDAEFQKKVLDGVQAMEGKQETLLKNYDSLDKETKKAFEELTLVKNKMNDQAEFLTKLQKVQTQLKRETRMAYGDPIQRIANDEELRARFNCAIRVALSTKGDLVPVCAPLLKVLGIEAKALGEDSSPGSTLINADLAKEIYDTLSTFGKWNTLGVRRLGTKVTSYPVKTTRPVAGFILTEGDEIPDDTNKAGSAGNLEAEVIAVLLNVSLQLLQDAEFDVTADVLNDFQEAFNYRLDYAAFVADGTADTTNGGQTGLFNFGTAAPAAAGNTTIEELQLADFVRCLTTVDPAVLSRMTKWWLHPHNLARVCLVRDENGRPLFQTALEAPSRGIGSILGSPTELVEVAPNSNAAGSKIAAFGDPQGLVVGIRQDFSFEASDHHKWNHLQRSFRGHGRAGVKGRRANAFAILTTAAA